MTNPYIDFLREEARFHRMFVEKVQTPVLIAMAASIDRMWLAVGKKKSKVKPRRRSAVKKRR